MSSSKRVLVCFAIPEEARFFKTRAVPSAGFILTGMGRRNAKEQLGKALQDSQVGAVVSAGFCGGLNPVLKPGAVVFNSQNPQLCAAALGLGWSSSSMTTIDQICCTTAGKEALWKKSGCDAVDMESAALAAECARLKVPFAVIKVVSDAADECMPLDFNKFVDANLALDMKRMIGQILLHPHKIPALLRFQARVKKSGQILADRLEEFVGSVRL